MTSFHHLLALAASLALISGCAAPSVSQPPGGRVALQPRVPCASLAGLQIPAADIALPTRGAVVSSAELVPRSAARTHPEVGTTRRFVPEHCKLLGRILSVDPAAPPILFQLNVPTAWNRGIIQVGGGGLNGSIPANLAAIGASGSPISQAMPPDASYPIAQGYAMFGGDSGHQGDGTDWTLNDEAWLNFGHAALKKTRDAAFALVRALYATAPERSYFMGQSQGGREALEVAQRYPADYDGVVATAPLIGYTAHVVAKAVYATLQTGAGWLSAEKAKAVGAEVVQQCDALDGLADGVISHYMACNARFADAAHTTTALQRLRCEGGADTGGSCLSDAQIATVAAMHEPTRFGFELANGLAEFPGYGTGREGVAWLNLNQRPGLPQRPNLGQPGITVQYGILKDPAFNLLSFRIAEHRERIVAASRLIDSTNPDLGAFFAHGGKLIVKSNSADYSVNPRTLARYVEAVVARHGRERVDEHLRYYVLPHAGHGGDGASATTGEPIPQYVDLITMMADWVERGIVPPDAPVLSAKSRQPPYAVTATRPMCRYPLYPRYAGHGDPKRAESFVCRAD